MSRSYTRSSPDGVSGVVDVDGGNSNIATKKQALVIPEQRYAEREKERASARNLDSATEGMSLTRASKDLNRAFPRPGTAPITDARLRRNLPGEIELRKNLSSRQRKARSVAKRAVLDTMPGTQHRALNGLVSDPKTWAETNAALSRVNGDAVLLDDKQRKEVQRIDRAIQSAESKTGRGHLVYTEVTMPHPLAGQHDWPSNLQPGAVISFDRFTAGTHTLHELDAHRGPNDVAFEIETSRGMYLGQSDSGNNTAHVLPRGMHVEVVAIHNAPYERPGQPPGERIVVQLREITTTEAT